VVLRVAIKPKAKPKDKESLGTDMAALHPNLRPEEKTVAKSVEDLESDEEGGGLAALMAYSDSDNEDSPVREKNRIKV